MGNKKLYFSEFLGTFLLVFFGTGAIIISEEYNGIIQAFGIGVVFGLTVWLLVYFFGKFSDCHINPAVTIGFLWNKQIPFKKAIFYILFQLTGAVFASISLHFLFAANKNLGNTLPSGSWQQSFLLEFLLSFILMLVILVSTTKKVLIKYAPFLIGFTVFLEAWLAGPICGASMNPARSFGPALVSNNLNYILIYFIAPIFGMLLMVLFWNKAKNISKKYYL